MATCMRCGREVRDYEMWWYGSNQVCQDCYQLYILEAQRKAQEEAKQCARCGRAIPLWGGMEFKGKTYCDSCYPEVRREFIEANSCKRCGRLIEREADRRRGPKGELLCPKCYEEARGRFGLGSVERLFCAGCGRRLSEGHAHHLGGAEVCDSCFKRITELETCSICGKRIGPIRMILPNGSAVCVDCAKKLKKR